jgi:hypothetical protein
MSSFLPRFTSPAYFQYLRVLRYASTPPPISIHSQFLMILVGYTSIRFALAAVSRCMNELHHSMKDKSTSFNEFVDKFMKIIEKKLGGWVAHNKR